MGNMQLKGPCDCRQADLKGFGRETTGRRKEGPGTEANKKVGSYYARTEYSTVNKTNQAQERVILGI